MATSVRETILDRVVTQLATITTGGGYEQTLTKVYRPQVAVLDIAQFPCVVVRDLGDEARWHLRGAYENTMTLELLAYVEKGDGDDRSEALSDLIADIVKLCAADETWNANARRSWVMAVVTSIEAEKPYAVGVVTLKILYRVTRTNPYATKAV